MHDLLRSRFKAYEQTPPPDAWKNIARQLDEKFISTDASISHKLENFAVAPPSGVWENIQKEIQPATENQIKKGARVVPFFTRRIAVAVIFLAVIALASLYFFTGNNNEQLAGSIPDKSARKSEKPGSADTVQAEKTYNIAENDRAIKEQSNQIALTPVNRTRKRNTNRRMASEKASAYNMASFANTIDEAHLSTPEPVSEYEVISVSAPPIRDSYGNIIMDLGVIRKPGQQYITVTSPNGNQTRISNKFLDCLRYINGNISWTEMDGDAAECRTRFENWRNKLLSDGSFIPTADNFFDIFELKEMIQE